MGRYLTDLADVLRAAGLRVVEVEGWRTRGFRHTSTPDGGLRAVEGILVHHTATPAARAGDYPSLAIVRDGRPDVGGPLAQLGLGRSGTWYVIAAGRANHSGAVDNPAYSNPRCLGIEAEHPGGAAPWPAEQYTSYVRGVAALRKHYGTAPPRGHKEAATPYGRKPDPTFDCPQFRRDVEAAERGKTPTTTTTQAKEIDPVSVIVKDPQGSRCYITDGLTKRYLSDPKVMAELRGALGVPFKAMAQYTIDRIPDQLTAIPAGLSVAQVREAVAAEVSELLPEGDPTARIVEGITSRLVEGIAITGTLSAGGK